MNVLGHDCILRAEMWDKMHYILRRYNDHMAHYCLFYEGQADISLLTQSLQLLLNSAPVLRSRFVTTPLWSFWQVTDVTVSDVLRVFETETPEEDALQFLLQEIPLDSPAQLRMAVFRREDRFALALLVNHMCLDGSDTLYFFRMLCQNYNALAEGRAPLLLRHGSRSHTKIYADLPPLQKLRAETMFRYRDKIRDSVYFPLTPVDPEDRRHLIFRAVAGDTLDRIIAYAKAHDATLNDLLTAAVIDVLYELCGIGRDKPFSVSYSLNLRRHMADAGASTGLTNHVAWMTCRTESNKADFPSLLRSVKASMDEGKADPYAGMHTLPLLSFACCALPLCITDPVVPLVYDNPHFELSNLGHIRSGEYAFRDARLTGGHLTGAVKRKPMFFLSISHFDDSLVLSTAFFGNDRDEETINAFFYKLMLLLTDLKS